MGRIRRGARPSVFRPGGAHSLFSPTEEPMANEEKNRLLEARVEGTPWRKWGPYLSERQWGTVREDESPGGDAWNYLSHDQARSRAYRWGEDGLAGISDDRQLLCFSLALWNGKDPILKERLFGLTNSEGNHGEDVKEYYFYLDSTPTHSYMRYLYKYPQAAYPYQQLLDENRRRSRQDLEYELLDTGIFEEDRYFDVFVEYAKASPEDVLIEVKIENRGPEAATIHVLPTLWFRNTWAGEPEGPRPLLTEGNGYGQTSVLAAEHPLLGTRYFYAAADAKLLFTDNDTNAFRFPNTKTSAKYYKDAFDFYVVHDNHDAVNPERRGTKAAAHQILKIEAKSGVTLRMRLSDKPPQSMGADPLGESFTHVMSARRGEADEFYSDAIPQNLSPDERYVSRQALSGMLWSKQYYDYDVASWLQQRGLDPFFDGRQAPRNSDWHHMVNGDVISMPDKWEYPWYAAWDLAFHAIPLGQVDPDFAKKQLLLLLQERYLHPNGQVPAYEWNFGDVNPPVHAWATYLLYQIDAQRTGVPDVSFLKQAFHKLLLNFTWWVNRKDRNGRNVFEGGFLGLDNIGVFDRSAPLPTGGHLEQADGTAWMAFYSQMMLQIAVELAVEDPTYAEMGLKFFEHFIWIAAAMTHIGGNVPMWDEEDGFFYDVLRLPDGGGTRLKVKSMVGLLPLTAGTVMTGLARQTAPDVVARAAWFVEHRPQLVANMHDPRKPGFRDRRLLAILGEDRLRRVLGHMLDENQFLSPFGVRSLSAQHRGAPYEFWVSGQKFSVSYLPAESDTGMFGGNSNWRGPIWMPVNALIIRALVNYFAYYGPDWKVECPTGSGRWLNLYEVAKDLTFRLARIFTLNEYGHRPVHGGAKKFQDDPLWRDHVLFYEYFHGDNGAGIGASHQTGWTGLVAPLMTFFARNSAEQILEADDLRARLHHMNVPHGVPAHGG
jgi:hypothetical protein